MAKKNKLHNVSENVTTENVQDVANEENATNSTPVNPGKEGKKMEKVILKVTTTFTTLENMEDVKVVKVEDFENVTSTEEALTRLSNDSAKLLEVINLGLQSLRKDQLRAEATGWRTLDNKGNPNGLFTGEMVDSDKVGGLILQFAKTNGYSDTKDSAKRKQIKEAAATLVKAIIQSNDEVRKSVAYAPVSEAAKPAETETEESPETA